MKLDEITKSVRREKYLPLGSVWSSKKYYDYIKTHNISLKLLVETAIDELIEKEEKKKAQEAIAL